MLWLFNKHKLINLLNYGNIKSKQIFNHRIVKWQIRNIKFQLAINNIQIYKNVNNILHKT